jgi:topoisomerase-4 subunit A
VVDEPVTVVVSQRAGCAPAPAMATTRPASRSRPATACMAPSSAARWTRCWCSATTAACTRCRWRCCPGARGDGQPVTTLIDLESGYPAAVLLCRGGGATLLLSGSGGYGFVATVEHMVARHKAGKAFITLPEGETVLPVAGVGRTVGCTPAGPAATHVACASTGGRILTFEITELKAMANGGRGLMLISWKPRTRWRALRPTPAACASKALAAVARSAMKRWRSAA